MSCENLAKADLSFNRWKPVKNVYFIKTEN